MLFKKKSPHTGACLACNMLVLVLLTLASLAAFLGVLKSHMPSTGFVFGSMTGSLAIMAFVISVSLTVHQLKYCAGGKCEMCNGK